MIIQHLVCLLVLIFQVILNCIDQCIAEKLAAVDLMFILYYQSFLYQILIWFDNAPPQIINFNFVAPHSNFVTI